MGTLRGGTTIAGFPAIHSGMQEAIFLGNVTIKGYLTLGKASSIRSEYNNAEVINDHNNGNISMSAVGGDLYMGYRNTGVIRLSSNLSNSSGTTVIDTGGKLYYQGENTDVRYVRSGVDSYVYGDTTGTTAYPRIMFKNSGATNVSYFRTPTGGMLPYSDGTAFVGTTAWRFKEMHAVDFYEDGTKLSSKYATSGHNHNGVYANSSHSHSNYVTKNGDRMSGALEIEGTSNDASRLTIFNTGTNPRNGGSLELLETGPKFGATNSNGFRIRYDGVGNELTVDSSYTSETRHLTIKRNGAITVSSSTNFNGSVFINSSLTDGYTTLNGSSIRFGASNKGYIGDNSSGWVFFGNNNNGSTYLRIYDNGGMAQLTGSLDVMGNVVASGNMISGGDVRGILTHDRSYGYIYPFSSSYSADNSYLRYYYAGSGTSTNTSNRNELRVHTMGSNAVNTRLVIDNETVPRISYGTGSPPSTSNFRNGDLHIQY